MSSEQHNGDGDFSGSAVTGQACLSDTNRLDNLRKKRSANETSFGRFAARDDDHRFHRRQNIKIHFRESRMGE